MYLAFVSFIAGVFTAFTPCVLPILPIMLAGELGDRSSKYKSLRVILSLIISVFVCTLLLKYSVLFAGVSPVYLRAFSGIILIAVAVFTFFPYLWVRIMSKLTIRNGVQILSGRSMKKTVPKYKDYVLGASLGPIFSSCSPTYFVILATVLPSNYLEGIVYLILYCTGLAFSLYCISIFGEPIIRLLTSHPTMETITTKTIAVLLFVTGVIIFFGYDSYIEKKVPSSTSLSRVEGTLLEKTNTRTKEAPSVAIDGRSKESLVLGEKMKEIAPVITNVTPVLKTTINTIGNKTFAPELSGISGYLNTDQHITLADALSKNKVVVVYFWTFGCINCKRALPSLNSLYAKYHAKGLEVIGVHTPEFAYERKKENIETAINSLDIHFPVVMDNEYSTWKSFDNTYWPRKYIILPTGEIIYEHAGEGAYDEIETIVANIILK